MHYPSDLPKALLLTQGLFTDPAAKTAHGLIRFTERYQVCGVIDATQAGKEAGEVLDGKHRGIPFFSSIPEALDQLGEKPEWAIVAVATAGGVLPASLETVITEAVSAGLSVVNGLHDFMENRPELVALAQQHHVQLLDIRKPKPFADLHFWDGSIFQVKCPIVAVLGTDCAIGKRTTARLLVQSLEKRNYRSHMVYTGQTGWMQGGKYGFIFDATPNDFVSGELEHAIVQCWQETQPDLIVLEGQSALLNASGPCGPEYLLSGNAKKVILQHAPARAYFKGWQHLDLKHHPLERSLQLVEAYGSEVMAITLNTQSMAKDDILLTVETMEAHFGIPVLAPLETGMGRLVDLLEKAGSLTTKG